MPPKDQRLKMPEGLSQSLKEHSKLIEQNKKEEPKTSRSSDVQTPKRPDVQTSERPSVQTSKRLEKEKKKRARHTIYLSPDISKELKLEALKRDQEMSEIVETALRELFK